MDMHDAKKGVMVKVCVRDKSDANLRIAAHVHLHVHPKGKDDSPPPVPGERGANWTKHEKMTRISDGCIEFDDLAPGHWYYATAHLGQVKGESERVFVDCPDHRTLEVRLDTGFRLQLLRDSDDCVPVDCNDLATGTTVLARVVFNPDLGEVDDIELDAVGFARLESRMVAAPFAVGRRDAADAMAAAADWRAARYWPFTPQRAGMFNVSTRAQLAGGGSIAGSHAVLVRDNIRQVAGDISVTLRRTAAEITEDLPLWVVIRNSTNALSFGNYALFLEQLFCGQRPNIQPAPHEAHFRRASRRFHDLADRRFLPYTDSDAYRVLKVATEAFVMVNCGVFLNRYPFNDADAAYVLRKVGVSADLGSFWADYLASVNGASDPMLPYLALVRQKLREFGVKRHLFEDPAHLPPRDFEECYGILASKLTAPCLLELIWSYWHEEGMLVQTMNAATRRFQNVRVQASGLDPLANFEVDPLRPLANLLWAYTQDEQHRLSVVRRNYEYDHEYGLRLEGLAVSNPRPADTRSKFLEAFHHLLYRASQFYKQDDNTTIVADGFPVLNALKEVHLILGEGAHNQFGDLPSTARIEMLMQQWLLARPEFRDFLPTRVMVAYPEPWMDRVDAMKRVQGWGDVNVLHFHNLGAFGEQLLLSIRYGAWSTVNDAAQGANWARFWRTEVQGYLHAYRAVTGIDISAIAGDARVDATLPSTLLRRRLAAEQPQRT